jgi:hypothetical protein
MDKDDAVKQHTRGHVFRRNLPRGDEGNSKRVTPYVFNLRNVLLYNWRGIIGYWYLEMQNSKQMAMRCFGYINRDDDSMFASRILSQRPCYKNSELVPDLENISIHIFTGE